MCVEIADGCVNWGPIGDLDDQFSQGVGGAVHGRWCPVGLPPGGVAGVWSGCALAHMVGPLVVEGRARLWCVCCWGA